MSESGPPPPGPRKKPGPTPRVPDPKKTKNTPARRPRTEPSIPKQMLTAAVSVLATLNPANSRFLRLLFAPPSDADVLIEGEHAFYREPKHPLVLLEPIAETVAILVLVTVILSRPSFEGLGLGLLALVLSVIVMWRWFKQREWGWSEFAWAIVALYVIAVNRIDYVNVVAAIGLWFIARLGIRILRWWAYELRYLTNRRIIEARGFFGLRVASMPVGKVTDLDFVYTATGEILGYAHLRIESAGQDQSLANIPFLLKPQTFHHLAVRLAGNRTELNRRDLDELREENFMDGRILSQIESIVRSQEAAAESRP